MQSLRVSVVLAVLLLAAAAPIASASSRDSDFQAYLLERAGAHGLTVDEYLTALRTQEQQQNDLQAVRDDPKRFGGIYWEWTAANPGFVVQYVGDFAPDFGPGFRYVQVNWSRADLEAALAQVVQLSRDPKTSGWVSAGIDESQ